jgi:hypothetical protein
VISVVVLQNQMDLLRAEFVSCGQTIDIKEEDEQERITVPVIKTEPKVSCFLGECMQAFYFFYPELSAPIL